MERLLKISTPTATSISKTERIGVSELPLSLPKFSRTYITEKQSGRNRDWRRG